MKLTCQTLSPVGAKARKLPKWDADRVLVAYPDDAECPVLKDEWQPVTLLDGRKAEVRRADCGLGCRCAGEVRIP